MKKHYIALLSVLLMIALIIGGVLLLQTGDNDRVGEKSSTHSVDKVDESQTITYSNGDFVFAPTDEDIAYDKENKILFYKNILDVYLHTEVTEGQSERIAQLVNGKIVGKIQGAINVLQIKVEGESSEELRQHANSLKDAEFVKFASLSFPSSISDHSVRDDLPDDNHWWKKAIEAYAAWAYVDNHPEEFETVKISVLENGNLDVKNNAFKDIIGDEGNTKRRKTSDHATIVTKIIMANEDEKSSRGIAANVSDVTFLNINKDINGNDYTNLPIVIAALKYSVIDEEAQIINNSWGTRIMSELNYQNEQVGLFSGLSASESYEEYVETMVNMNDENSAILIHVLNDLLEIGYSDFLFVQSAGNGLIRYKEGKKGAEEPSMNNTAGAELTGYFTNINERTYKKAVRFYGVLENSLAEIRDHLIIVGGAEEIESSYSAPIWAGFGSLVDIVAPAKNIYIDDEFTSEEGTSFAAPMVSGAAALVWSYEPALTAREVKERLITRATKHVVETKGKVDSYPMLNVTTSLTECAFYYCELLEMYSTAINEQWAFDRLEKENLGPEQYGLDPLPTDYGYIFTDINHDGMQEMILGTILEDGRAWIDEIYTVVNQTPVKIFESAIRRGLYIYADGTIEENGMISMEQSASQFYVVNVDGTPEMQAGYIENMATGTYESLTTPNQEWSETEVEDFRKNLGQAIEYEFKPFMTEQVHSK